jgi:hypothetical protein
MGVVVCKTEYGYSWQPSNGRAYSIQLEQVMPDRAKQRILEAFKLDAKLKLYFRYYIYDKTNKLLFLSDSRII